MRVLFGENLILEPLVLRADDLECRGAAEAGLTGGAGDDPKVVQSKAIYVLTLPATIKVPPFAHD